MQAFNKEHASNYDQRYAKLAPQRDALHLLIRILFSDLPSRSRILCVGAGTGAEMIALAKAFPNFEFTAVEPSEPMLDVCRERAAQEGITARCTFHHGYIHTLESSTPFDAATSLLVSQFLVDRSERVAFFEDIARRLRPGACLVNADLSADLDSPDSEGLKDFWAKMLVFSDSPPDQARNYLKGWKEHVGVLPPDQVAAIITDGGFEKPVLFSQSLFIHAWYAKRPA